MNSRESHGPDCTCSECLLGEDETEVDLTGSIMINEVYAINEKVSGSCQKIFKTKDKMLEKTDNVESNDNDPDLLIYIPFSSQVKVRTMTMIGGEEGTAPARIKLFVNQNNPDFDLAESPASQTLDCLENPEGELIYQLMPSKFNNTWSITLLVTLNYGADHSKIYYIGFTGVDTHKRKKIMIGNYELKPLPDSIKQQKEPSVNKDMIYG